MADEDRYRWRLSLNFYVMRYENRHEGSYPASLARRLDWLLVLASPRAEKATSNTPKHCKFTPGRTAIEHTKSRIGIF